MRRYPARAPAVDRTPGIYWTVKNVTAHLLVDNSGLLTTMQIFRSRLALRAALSL